MITITLIVPLFVAIIAGIVHVYHPNSYVKRLAEITYWISVFFTFWLSFGHGAPLIR